MLIHSEPKTFQEALVTINFLRKAIVSLNIDCKEKDNRVEEMTKNIKKVLKQKVKLYFSNNLLGGL